MKRLFFALSLITTTLCWSPLYCAFVMVQDSRRKDKPPSESYVLLAKYFKEPSRVTAQEITELHKLLVSDSRFISDMTYGEIQCTLAHRFVLKENLNALRELVELEGSQDVVDRNNATPLEIARMMKGYPQSDPAIYNKMISLLENAQPRERPQVSSSTQDEQDSLESNIIDAKKGVLGEISQESYDLIVSCKENPSAVTAENVKELHNKLKLENRSISDMMISAKGSHWTLAHLFVSAKNLDALTQLVNLEGAQDREDGFWHLTPLSLAFTFTGTKVENRSILDILADTDTTSFKVKLWRKRALVRAKSVKKDENYPILDKMICLLENARSLARSTVVPPQDKQRPDDSKDRDDTKKSSSDSGQPNGDQAEDSSSNGPVLPPLDDHDQSSDLSSSRASDSIPIPAAQVKKSAQKENSQKTLSSSSSKPGLLKPLIGAIVISIGLWIIKSYMTANSQVSQDLADAEVA